MSKSNPITGMSLPLKGKFYIVSNYGDALTGKAYTNQGIDFASEEEQNVYAPFDLTIKYINQWRNTYSTNVIATFGNEQTWLVLSNLDKINVVANQKISRGSIVGSIKKYDKDIKNHLHIEIHNEVSFIPNSNTSDPSLYFNLENVENKRWNEEVIDGSKPTIYDIKTIDISNSNSVEDTGLKLFGRKISIIISDEKGNALDISNLSCEFDVQKTCLSRSTAVSTVKIYNLTTSTENVIINSAERIIISAGYEGTGRFGVIFAGRVFQPIRSKENGTDYVLTLLCTDSSQLNASYGFISSSAIPGTSLKEITQKCARNNLDEKCNVTLESESFPDTSIVKGRVLFGSSQDILQTISSDNNLLLYFEDGVGKTIDLLKSDENEAIELNYSSGLIGTPQQISISGGGFAVKAKCLLDPLIDRNTKVHIDSRIIQLQEYEIGSTYPLSPDNSGLYRVLIVDHRGNTRGNDWYTEFTAISQTSKLASFVTEDTKHVV